MNIETALKKAGKLLSSGDAPSALGVVNEILAKYPANITAQKIAKQIASAQNPTQVIKSEEPTIEGVVRLLAKGENETSLDLLSKMDLSDRKGADLNNLKGIALSRLGRLKEATDAYQKALKIAPQRADIVFNLAVNLAKDHKSEQAIDSYRRALKLEPTNHNARLNLAQVLINKRRTEEAEQLLQSAGLPNDLESVKFFLEGRIEELRLNYNEAKLRYTKATELNPGFAMAYQAIGVILTKQNASLAAINAFNTAIYYDQRCIEALIGVGNSYELIGLYDEAINKYHEALKLSETSEVYCSLAKCHKVIGEPSIAIQLCNKSLELDAKHPPTLLMMGDLHKNENDTNRSISFYSKIDDDTLQYITEYKEALSRLVEIYSRTGPQDLLEECLERSALKSVCNPLIGNAVDRANKTFALRISNPFCVNAIHKVMHLDILDELDFAKEVKEPIHSLINAGKSKNRPQGLLANGDQTAGNIFRSGVDGMRELERMLRGYCEEYRRQYLGLDDGIARYWPEKYGINGWLINMKSGGVLKPHIHETGWVSGSLYIEVPDDVPVHEANIVFSEFELDDDTGRETHRSVRVKAGSLCLFPSSLTHYTTAFQSDKRRLLIAFDLEPLH